MEKSESKKMIPLYLQELFLQKTDGNHFLRMPEIIEYLEKQGIIADRRTIYHDFSILNSAGFEIKGVRERGGYKYHHPQRLFSKNELKFLIDAVAASKFLTEKTSKELAEKIKSLGSSFDGAELNRNLLLGKRIKTMNDRVLKNLDSIYSAINGNAEISFQYMRWNFKRELEFMRKGEAFVVSPFSVTLVDENYYLIAFSSETNTIRHYRIDKMKSIKSTDNKREGMDLYKSFDVVDYTRKTFGMFGGREENVTLEVSNSLAGVIIDRFGDYANIRPNFNNPDTFMARISVQISPQFFGWLFGLGEGIKIISPPSVVEEYKANLEQILKKYTP